STPSACGGLPAGTVAPRPASRPKSARSTPAAATAPASWPVRDDGTSRQGKWRVTAKAIVTEGLKWAPDRCPAAAIITMMTRPKHAATPPWPSAPVAWVTTIEPQPPVTSANVPTPSAAARRQSTGGVTASSLLLEEGQQIADPRVQLVARALERLPPLRLL